MAEEEEDAKEQKPRRTTPFCNYLSASLLVCSVLLLTQILVLVRLIRMRRHPFLTLLPTQCSWLSLTVQQSLCITALVLAGVVLLYLLYECSQPYLSKAARQGYATLSTSASSSSSFEWICREYALMAVRLALIAIVMCQLFVMARPDLYLVLGGVASAVLCYALFLILLIRDMDQVQQEEAAAIPNNNNNNNNNPNFKQIHPASLTPNKQEKRARQLRRFLIQRHIWVWPVLAALVAATLFMILGFLQTFGQVDPLFTPDQIKHMDAVAPNLTIPDSGKRVVVIILDGFRLDEMNTNKHWQDLLSDPDWADHLAVLEGRAAIPTVSLPNWATLETGAAPEMTGILGNQLVPETIMDSIFAQCQKLDTPVDLTAMNPDLSYAHSKNLSLEAAQGASDFFTYRRAVIGSPWLSILVATKLVPLESFGPVPVLTPGNQVDTYPESVTLNGLLNLISGTTSLTLPLRDTPGTDAVLGASERTDGIRAQIALRALSETGSDRYRLVYLHLESTDHIAHRVGTHSPLYHHAAAMQAQAIRQVLEVVDNDTLVIITSDHGHVTEGGHGGTARELRRVPLILFYPNASQLSEPYRNRHPVLTPDGTLLSTGPNRHRVFDLADVPTTAAMVLGLPVPRQSTGIYIEDALPFLSDNQDVRDAQFMDLFEQRRVYLQHFLAQLGAMPDTIQDLYETYPALDTFSAFEQWVNATFGLNPLFTATDLFAAGVFELQVMLERIREAVLTLSVVRNLTFAGASALCLLAVLWSRFLLHHRTVKDDTRIALFALLAVVLYMAACLCVYTVTFAVLGYGNWDSTQLHSDMVIGRFALLSLLPGTAFMILELRILAWPKLTPTTESKALGELYELWRLLWTDYYVWNGHVQKTSTLLLFFSYQLMMAVSAVCILAALTSAFYFFYPLNVTLFVQSAPMWRFRFEVLSTAIMMIPLVLFLWWYNAIFSRSLTLHMAQVVKK